MFKTAIFGGTTEGRLLAEYCCQRGVEAGVSVASGYGRHLLPTALQDVQEGPMDERQMEEWLAAQGADLVLDATHPYAKEASANIRAACEALYIPYVRVVRRPGGGEKEGDVVYCASAAEAASYLDGRDGPVFITTGSKELEAFSGMRNFQKRTFVRVIPSADSIAECERLGLSGRQIIAMQGPFSRELNSAMLRQTKACYLVTKEAGAAGGFEEKLAAARECRVTVLVVERPPDDEEGISVEEAMRLLARRGNQKRRVYLIGSGMGGRGQMTGEAAEALRDCDLLLGAPRMLENVRDLAGRSVPMEPIYAGEAVFQYLEEHEEYGRIGVIYSGDPGFYSGAEQLRRLLDEVRPDAYEVKTLPGISSVSALCAKAGVSWEDVRMVSAHGRDCDLAGEVAAHRRLFALMGGKDAVKRLCRELIKAGYGNARLTVGERLSYPEERLTAGTPKELGGLEFDGLAAVLIERRGGDEG